MKYLRFATYLILIAAAWASGHFGRTIPVTLTSGPIGHANEEARAANKTFTEEKSILDCSRSGREVLSIAQSVMRKYHVGRGSGVAEVPSVKLRSKDGQTVWALAFEYPDPPPGGPSRFVVEIEDASGQVSMNGKAEPNKPVQTTAMTPPPSTTPGAPLPDL